VNVNCVQASAPGKLLLIGEYAVLDGAPALVMAVDRRVKVRLRRASSGTGWLSAAQLGFERAAMRVEGDVLRCDGADLAAAFCGGISEFRSTDEFAICTPANWPKDLHWRAIWTRQAAQTTDFVGAFDTWKLADPVSAGRIRSRLDEIARHAAANAHDGAVLFDACAAYAAEMVALGDAMGEEVMTAPSTAGQAWTRVRRGLQELWRRWWRPWNCPGA
jgi:hypothetical protein